jgi:hypothetical protein
MKEHPKHIRAVLVAMIALCFMWLLASAIVTVPAFAEGDTPSLPPVSLPADSAIITGKAVIPNGSPTSTDVFEIVVLFFEAVL